MSLSQVFASSRRGLSFELFPPKTEAGKAEMFAQLQELIPFRPDFVTCTYGAGGSTRDKTLSICGEIRSRYNLPVATHLTCVASTLDDLRQYLRQAEASKVDYVVALRGDPPKGEQCFTQHEGGLRYANELVELIRSEFPSFGIAVAGYPETHQEAPSPELDLIHLKRKVDAGADIIITQLFYNNDDYFRFEERCRAEGISVPIVPGILPVQSLSQIQRIAALCKASLPGELTQKLSEKQGDDNAQIEIGIEFACKQVEELLEQGVPGVHFYVLNKSRSTAAVLRHVDWLD